MPFSNGLLKRSSGLCIALAAVVCIFVPSTGRSQGELDPEDLWYRGFLLVESAREKEVRGEYLAAFNQLGEAKQFFDFLATSFPEYLKEIVTERRHLNTEKREELKILMNQPKPSVIRQPQGQTLQKTFWIALGVCVGLLALVWFVFRQIYLR